MIVKISEFMINLVVIAVCACVILVLLRETLNIAKSINK